MKEFSGSSSREELLEDEPFEDVLSREKLPKELSPEELFPEETLPEDLSLEFEDSFATETVPKDLPDQDRSTGDKLSEDLPAQDRSTGDSLSEDLSPEKDRETEKDPEAPDIGRDIAKSLRAAMQWCDDVANKPNDLMTNFRSQMPFFVILVVIILLLWVLKIIYG
jgi:hypothetical protein